HDSLLRQNAEIDRLQLPRISDDDELEELVGREELVAIRDTQTLRVDPKLDRNRRFCRPWTLQFLEDLAEAYYKEFRKPIQVNSAGITATPRPPRATLPPPTLLALPWILPSAA